MVTNAAFAERLSHLTTCSNTVEDFVVTWYKRCHDHSHFDLRDVMSLHTKLIIVILVLLVVVFAGYSLSFAAPAQLPPP
jgi:hypothetical protein